MDDVRRGAAAAELIRNIWRNPVSRHLICWATAIGAFYQVVRAVEPNAVAIRVVAIVFLPAPVPIYLHAAAMRGLFERRRYRTYAAAVLLIVLGSEPFFDWVYLAILRDETTRTSGAFTALFLIAFTVGLKFYSQGLTQKYRLQEVEYKQAQAELALLRSQIHPHFLFNTLNNLYALTLERPELASEGILKLSGLMRYVLDGSSRKTVPLEEELKFIQDYVALEELRLDGAPDIRFVVGGGVEGASIAPLLLIPFVENGFKHGLSPLQGKGHVHIDVAVEGGVLSFVMENSKAEDCSEHRGAPAGTGLANVRRRLELIYPGAHKLEVDDRGDRYRVELEVGL